MLTQNHFHSIEVDTYVLRLNKDVDRRGMEVGYDQKKRQEEGVI